MSLCINPQCQQSQNSDTLLFCKGCGSELLIDGRYRVQSLLGQGGFGLTYQVAASAKFLPNENISKLRISNSSNRKSLVGFRKNTRAACIIL